MEVPGIGKELTDGEIIGNGTFALHVYVHDDSLCFAFFLGEDSEGTASTKKNSK